MSYSRLPVHAFIDESGNHDLETSKHGTSELFVLTAVIIKDDNILECENGLKNVREKYFGNTKDKEIKSSSLVGRNRHKKRLRILRELKDLPFKYYSLFIKKELVFKDSGLCYKSSFYKYFNRYFYSKLIVEGRNITIVSDEIGSKEYMQSFVPYLERKIAPSLFPFWQHKFVDSKDSLGVQLADFISGILGKCFDRSRSSEFSQDFYDLISDKQLGLNFFPNYDFGREATHISRFLNEEIIGQLNSERALKFIKIHSNSEEEKDRQKAFVLEMLYNEAHFGAINGDRRICKNELMRRLEDNGMPVSSDRYFTSKILGAIRDNNILISGNKKGYKLALNSIDVHYYLKHTKSVVEPMLSRLKAIRESFLFSTDGDLDILSLPGFDNLEKLIFSLSPKPAIKDITENNQNSRSA